MRTILTNCHVIDCLGGDPQHDMSVVIEGNYIHKVQSGLDLKAEGDKKTRIIDTKGGYLLPGLWDVHEHPGDLYPDPRHMMLGESTISRAIRAGRNAMDALRNGITSIRVLGEENYLDVAWRDAFKLGVMVGPRLFVAGKCVIATGGHGHDFPGSVVEIDGPYEMRKAVREQLKHGVDFIKLAVTGGVATMGETMQESQLLLDEIQAATEVAHQKGKRVAVHAGGPGGVKTAIRGGVDSIEHGYYLDDEAIEMMVKADVFYVPTINVTQYEAYMKRTGAAEHHINKATGAAAAHREGFQKALKAGVKIASGADYSPMGELGLVEIEQLVAAGMTEMQALIAATHTSADLCGMADQLGTVEEGKLADLVVLAENPLEDIKNIRKLKMVFKEGNLIDRTPEEGLADFWELYY
jgi:imidazolonepropionase-like amidohydrolase